MGNLLNKFKKVNNYEIVNSGRKNLLYDNINEELEDNKKQIKNLRDSVSSLENNYSNLLNQLNMEMIHIKNDISKILLNKNNNNLENEIQGLKNRIVILESNDQFHSMVQ